MCLLGANLFQFPTGWNSTKGEVFQYIRTFEVSIPNGMEFYIFLSIF